MSQSLKDIHKAAITQVNHDIAIDTLIRHLQAHNAGFYITDKCPRCKTNFEALRIEGPGDYEPKFREYDVNGNLKFEYDIGLIGEDGSLKAILEALNTHKMGADKRKYADSKGYPWIEYSVPAMLASDRNGSVHSRSGWLELEALKLKIGHSGPLYCPLCSEQVERERETVERRERMRRRINEGEEARRKTMKEIVEPTERDLNQAIGQIESMDPGFTSASLNKMEDGLADFVAFEKEMRERLLEAEQVIVQLHAVEVEVNAESKSRKDKSFCSKTGLELTTEFDEMIVKGFKNFSLRIEQVNNRCAELNSLIEIKQRELMSLREWCT